MIKLIIASALLVAVQSASVRIVNGTDAEEGEFPFAVSLRRSQIKHTCGATILNKNFILTAAHCVCDDNKPKNASDYTIQYGSREISETYDRSVQVAKIYCNDFSMEELIFDSAILELETEIPKGNWETVKLAKRFDTMEQQKGIVIGWGRLWQDGPISPILQKLEVDIYDEVVCSKYGNEHHICFGAELGGACNGDSGTSLLSTEKVQVGIASFITSTCGIANKEYPNVYSRVSRYYDWIENIAGEVSYV